METEALWRHRLILLALAVAAVASGGFAFYLLAMSPLSILLLPFAVLFLVVGPLYAVAVESVGHNGLWEEMRQFDEGLVVESMLSIIASLTGLLLASTFPLPLVSILYRTAAVAPTAVVFLVGVAFTIRLTRRMAVVRHLASERRKAPSLARPLVRRQSWMWEEAYFGVIVCLMLAAMVPPFLLFVSTHYSTAEIHETPVVGWLILAAGLFCLLAAGVSYLKAKIKHKETNHVDNTTN